MKDEIQKLYYQLNYSEIRRRLGPTVADLLDKYPTHTNRDELNRVAWKNFRKAVKDYTNKETQEPFENYYASIAEKEIVKLLNSYVRTSKNKKDQRKVGRNIPPDS